MTETIDRCLSHSVCQHTALSRQVRSCDTHTASLAEWLRRPPRERKIPGWNPACAGIFPGSSHTSDFKIGTPVATLPGAWRYRVSTGTGRPGVSIRGLGEVESFICNFYLSVAARAIVSADPSQRYTSMLLGRLASNQPTNPVIPFADRTFNTQTSGS